MSFGLEQVPAIRPFGKKFSTFFEVTGWAREHNIANIIGSATNKWYYMLYVVFCHLLMAVIALPLLPFILVLNILSSMRTLRIPQSCSSSMPVHPFPFTDHPTISHIILVKPKLSFITMAYMPSAATRQTLITLNRPICTSTSINDLGVLLPVLSDLGTSPSPIFGIMILVRFRTAFLTAWLQSKESVFLEEIRSSGELLLTFCAAFQWYTIHAVETILSIVAPLDVCGIAEVFFCLIIA